MDLIPMMLLVAWLSAGLVMLILWIVYLVKNNAGVVDIGWSGNFALIAGAYDLLGTGTQPRQALMTAMVVLWSLRLALYVLRRAAGREEDPRYRQLRKEWGGNIRLKFFFFFQFQAATNVILSVPFLLASINPAPRLSILEWVGFGLWCVAVIGESVADRQLKRFKSNPAHQGKVCRVGLWNYSRHPNYFFEWLIWVAFFVFALGSPYGYLAIISPALMLYFLFRVTGIPATEAQALRSKGEAYREYQRTTSAFVPWFPKASGPHSEVNV